MTEDNHPGFSLQGEVKALRLMVALMVTFFLIGLMVGNLFAVFQIPKMEKIFEEMLGDRNKLPELTKCVISYGRLGLLPLALVAMVPVSTSVIYVLFRKTRWAQVFVALVILFLILHWIVIAFALRIPLLQIIQGINATTF
jgi:hypothetical protein